MDVFSLYCRDGCWEHQAFCPMGKAAKALSPQHSTNAQGQLYLFFYSLKQNTKIPSTLLFFIYFLLLLVG
jgi:hypothetical protein